MRAKHPNFLPPSQLVCLRFLNTATTTYPNMPRQNMLEAIYGPELVTILKEMEEIYPPLSAGPTDEISHIMYRAGQRSVVDWLSNRITENN
jgi:hypothetical protein